MATRTGIAVKHNIEVAHRLFELPGKCEQIHGHSMWVTMSLEGTLNDHGILAGIEYGALKKLFRGYLDSEFDHHLLLNADDPWAQGVPYMEDGYSNAGDKLPGLKLFDGDPTTENIAKQICEVMLDNFEHAVGFKDILNDLDKIRVEVWETSVNMAYYERDGDL